MEQLCYYIFWALLVFAKGIGLNSGDKLYYVISGIALLFLVIKLLITRHSIKEYGIIALLCSIALIAYYHSGRMAIVLTIFTLVGLKNIRLKPLFQIGLAVWSISFLTTLFLNLTGLRESLMIVQEKGDLGFVIRWGLGYNICNMLQMTYLIWVVYLVYCLDRKYNIKWCISLLIGNAFIFYYSISYTGFALCSLYLIVNLIYYGYLKYLEKKKNNQQRLHLYIKKVSIFVGYMVLPGCIGVSFICPFLMKNPIVKKIDHLLSYRFGISQIFLTEEKITLLGTRLSSMRNSWDLIDCAYVFMFINYGIIAILLFVLAYCLVIHKYIKQTKVKELFVIYVFLIYGITEQFIANASLNISFLFIGEQLFLWTAVMKNQSTYSWIPKLDRPINIIDSKIGGFVIQKYNILCTYWKKIAIVTLIAGIFGSLIYVLFIPKDSLVEVPLSASEYVQAQSALIEIEDNTEEGIKQAIQACENKLQDTSKIQEILTKSNSGFTVWQVQQMVDIGFPNYLKENEDYSTFRIRILMLYKNLPGEEAVLYQELQKELLSAIINTDHMKVIELFEEDIYRNTGKEKTEHITKVKERKQQRDGYLVTLENRRKIVGYGYVTAFGTLVLSGIFILIVKRKEGIKVEN